MRYCFFDVVFVKTPITSYARIHFATQETNKNIEPRLAGGPININRNLPAGDVFGFRDAFRMLPEYFQMLLSASGMLYPCAGDTIRKNGRKERRRNKEDTQ